MADVAAVAAGGTPLRPVESGERLAGIDTLRGVAVLGILVMNIPFFALSDYAFLNPTVAGGFRGLDFAAWLLGHLLFDLKMMAIFSLLFGAGIAVMTERAAARGVSLGRIHYRRMGWLLVIGLVHAYLLWYGDILVAYALCGMLVFPLRRLRARVLIPLGLAITLVAAGLTAGHGAALGALRDESIAAQAAAGQDEDPTDAQLGAVKAWQDASRPFVPTAEALQSEAETYRRGGWALLGLRSTQSLWFQTFGMAFFGLWRCGGLMVVGMGLYKTGALSGALRRRAYWGMVVVGYGVGLPLVSFGAHDMIAHGFDLPYMFLRGGQFNYVGSLFVAAGHVGVVMLACASGVAGRALARLAAVGRMALTNYLAQTVICASIFYGDGLGLWGRFGRFELLGFVAAIWTVELAWSPWWLARHRFGPVEWLWRRLTYGPPTRTARDSRTVTSAAPP